MAWKKAAGRLSGGQDDVEKFAEILF